MRVTQTVNIENIIYAKRLPLNRKVMNFALDMLVGQVFPPICVERVKGGYALRGGRHRLAAQKLLGRKQVRVHVAIKEDPRPEKPLVCKEQPCQK